MQSRIHPSLFLVHTEPKLVKEALQESKWFAAMTCGSNAFQDYFDDAKESRVKQIPKFQDTRFKNQVSRIKFQESRFKIQDSRIKFQESSFKIQDQDSRLKIQESREASIKISTKNVFQNIE